MGKTKKIKSLEVDKNIEQEAVNLPPVSTAEEMKVINEVETTKFPEETPAQIMSPTIVDEREVEKPIASQADTNEPDAFYSLWQEFFRHLEHERIINADKPASKALIANAGAYMTKALKTIEAIRQLP